MSDLAGQIDIRLTLGGSPAVCIGSSRPLMAPRVFAGKSLATVTGQLPLLFSVCGTAQSVACANACEAALGLVPAPSARWARALLLRAETVKEHLWRLLLDWPMALARLQTAPAADLSALSAERAAAMAGVMRAFLQLRAALTRGGDPFLPGAGGIRPPADGVASACRLLVDTAAAQVFGAMPAEWLATTATAAALQDWAAVTPSTGAALVQALTAPSAQGRPGCTLAELGRSEVGPLPSTDGGPESRLLQRLAPALAAADADHFVAQPTLDGSPAETTPFARELGRGGLVADLAARHGNGLLPRLGALLAELARDTALLAAPEAMDVPAAAALAVAAEPAVRVGLGAAPAARGLLVHRVVVDAGSAADAVCVRGYRILAPTEWNFHPAGVVAAGLNAIANAGGLVSDPRSGDPTGREPLYRLLVTAVDPCVDYRLSVS